MSDLILTPPECTGIFGFLFGHKFRARYSTGAPTVQITDNATLLSEQALTLIEVSKPKTYVIDLCSRCGAPAGK